MKKDVSMKEPIDFLEVIDGIKKNQEAELKEAFKQMRIMYLEMTQAGFTAEEAMIYLAALTRPPSTRKE